MNIVALIIARKFSITFVRTVALSFSLKVALNVHSMLYSIYNPTCTRPFERGVRALQQPLPQN